MPDSAFSSAFQTPGDPSTKNLHIQTSAFGNPIPVLHGRNRVTAQLIYLTDFVTYAQSQTQGGKGGSSGGQTSTTYTYEAALAMVVCEGPLAYDGNPAHSFNGVYKGWRNREVLSLTRLEAAWAAFQGNIPQTPWSYTTSHHPGEDVPYSGLAYMAHATAVLDSNGGVQSHSFEVQGPHSNFVSQGVYGCSPLDSINGFLTDSQSGAQFSYFNPTPMGYTPNSSTHTAGQYWAAAGIFISPVWDTQQTARDHMTALMDTLNSEFIWSENTLKIVPYGDTPLFYMAPDSTQYGYDPTNAIMPVADFTIADFLPSETPDRGGKGPKKDPIQVERVSYTDPPNIVRIEFTNSAKQYSPEIAEARDADDIALYGQRVGQTIQAHWITDAATAKQVAQLMLQRGLYVRNTYKFMVDMRYCLLEPMDIVVLGYAPLGMVGLSVRIKKISETPTGTLMIEAEDMPTGIGTATAYATQGSSGYSPDNGVDPGAANAPVIFQPPVAESGGVRQLWMVASGGANWGGAFVWVSQDNVNYQQVGVIYRGRHGVLTSGLAAAPAGTDNTNTLSVDLTVSLGSLTGGSATDLAALNTACYVDGEILAFQNAALTSAYNYNLSPLNRGAYGSSSGAHLTATKFARLDGAVFKYAIPASYDGQTIYVKLQSFNSFGNSTQDLSACTAYTFTIDTPVLVHAIVASPSNSMGAANVTDAIITVDVSGGPYRLSLPGRVSGVEPGTQIYTVKVLPLPAGSTLTNAVTIAPPTGATIDNYAEVLVSPGSSITVRYDGTNYWVIAATGTGYTATGFGDDLGGNFGGGFG